MKIKTILASDVAKLDSNVLTGGGTDDTLALQRALDEALICGGVKLIMDGAALVRGLKVHSNTTIECMSADCGFYLADGSDCAVLTNANWRMYSLDTRNITLIGGTYNQNCLHQQHDVPRTPETAMDEVPADMGNHWVYGLEFYGVENLTLRDLVIRNQRTFAFMLGCFRRCTIDNVWIDMIDYMPSNNQDGFHFWGPGEFLTIRNVGGRVGDDFMNLGPDEHDGKSSITDVLVDGVYLDDADQAIRLLSKGTGRLDRVTIRNVSGCYHGLGFYVNPWFPGDTYGRFGNIKFENIDLRPLDVHYINDPFLFAVGGNIERMTFQNIHHHHAKYKYNLFQLGRTTYSDEFNASHMLEPHIGTLVIDGLTVDDDDPDAADTEYIYAKCRIDNLILRDINVLRAPELERCGVLLKAYPGSRIENLLVDRVYAQKLRAFAELAEGTVQTDVRTDVRQV